MRLALEQAALAAELGEVPIGAVVVCEETTEAGECVQHPTLVAAAHNRREIDNDPAAHAELLAIRAAAQGLGRWRLSDCTVYVTLEPCPMCAGLMHQARIKRCVYGAVDPKGGALGTLYSLHEDTRLNHRFDVSSGVLAQESGAVLQDFFQRLRKEP